MKKILNKLFYNLGYEVKKIDKEFLNLSIEDVLKKKINKNPIIFDIGGNKGQSIAKYKTLFNNPIIHSFEPLKSEFEIMKNKFESDNDIILNNYAMGETPGKKTFNISAQTGASSFNNINLNSKWAKVRSKEFNKSINQFISSTEVKISTVDDYVFDNNIENIDLLKIDTQGYEDKVLKGSLKTLSDNKIKVIVTEIMFDDVYDKYLSFSEIEKFLLPNDFRMVGIYLSSNSLFDNLTFFADVCYFNKKYFDL